MSKFKVGDAVRVKAPYGGLPAVGTEGKILRAGGSLLAEFPGWTGGHDGFSELGLHDGAKSRWYIVESDVELIAAEGKEEEPATREWGAWNRDTPAELSPAAPVEAEAPASKFKAGDVVVALHDDCDITKGTKYVVQIDGDGDPFVIDNAGDRWHINKDDYEISEVIEPKAGDFVRHGDEFRKVVAVLGDKAWITGAGDNDYVVRKLHLSAA